MPIKMSNVRNDKRTVKAIYYGEECEVTYKPSEWTPAVQDEIRDAENTDQMCATICSMVTAWDILGEDDQPVPLDVEHVRQLPQPLLLAVVTACQEDMVPKSKNGRR